jgi:hypothetical protein
LLSEVRGPALTPFLDVSWHLLANGTLYEDPGAQFFELRHDPEVEAKRLRHRIEDSGFDVSFAPPAA